MKRSFFYIVLFVFCVPSIVHATDLTFIVASDPHFGYLSDESPNTATVISMNNLVSMPYPPEVGGVVDKPAFVIMTGDLADDPPDWSAPDGFLVHYGFDGTDGMVNCPVYITRGNHDMYPEMKTWITARHGGLYYSFDRNGIHFVCMDVYPTTVIADWLRDDLAGLADADTPIILYQHYAPSYSGAIMDVIHGYNILALFHGHEHESYHSVYNDPGSDGQYDIFSVGSPVKGNSHYFYVVHIDDGRMDVVENSCFQAGQWRNYYTKILAQFPSITFDNAIDTFIASGVPNGDYSIAPVLSVDSDNGSFGGGPTQALLRFDNIFGSGAGQVPPNSNIISALLKLNTTDTGDGASVYSMTVDWEDTDNWNFFGGDGIQPSIETRPSPDAAVSGSSSGITIVDVTASVEEWQSPTSSNYGWALLPLGNDEWGFHSAQGGARPELTVTYQIDGDITRDGRVDLEDFAEISLYWNTSAGSADIGPLGDLDGFVDIIDVSVLCENWLTGTE